MNRSDWGYWAWFVGMAAFLLVPIGFAIATTIHPYYWMAADGVITDAAMPGYTVRCHSEDYRLVVEYANQGRAYIHCERMP